MREMKTLFDHYLYTFLGQFKCQKMTPNVKIFKNLILLSSLRKQEDRDVKMSLINELMVW